MHSAFESEDKAQQMLKSVVGSLKKGGRLITFIPDPDFLSETVEKLSARMAAKKQWAQIATKKMENWKKANQKRLQNGATLSAVFASLARRLTMASFDHHLDGNTTTSCTRLLKKFQNMVSPGTPSEPLPRSRGLHPGNAVLSKVG
jgi:hypothetical protein